MNHSVEKIVGLQEHMPEKLKKTACVPTVWDKSCRVNFSNTIENRFFTDVTHLTIRIRKLVVLVVLCRLIQREWLVTSARSRISFDDNSRRSAARYLGRLRIQ